MCQRPEGHVTRENGISMCFMEDSILPEPPLMISSNINPWASTTPMLSSKVTIAIQWSCHQIQREDDVANQHPPRRLLQYLKKNACILTNPKYRKLRIGNRIFMETIYNTGAHGILLALGFEEHFGYLEMGPGEGTLVYDRIRDVSDAMMKVDQTLKITQDWVDGDGHHVDITAQLEGADGYGRADFGYAGSMNA